MSDVALNLAERIGRTRIPLSKIDGVVSEHLGPARVYGNAQPSVLYRQIAMYLGKHVGGWSTTRIGKFYHGRDHSTVCYAIRRIESLRRRDTAVDALLVKLSELCQQDTGEQPNPMMSVFKRALRDHFDHALIEELVDRIIDCIVARVELGASTRPGYLPEEDSRADSRRTALQTPVKETPFSESPFPARAEWMEQDHDNEGKPEKTGT